MKWFLLFAFHGLKVFSTSGNWNIGEGHISSIHVKSSVLFIIALLKKYELHGPFTVSPRDFGQILDFQSFSFLACDPVQRYGDFSARSPIIRRAPIFSEYHAHVIKVLDMAWEGTHQYNSNKALQSWSYFRFTHFTVECELRLIPVYPNPHKRDVDAKLMLFWNRHGRAKFLGV